MLSLVTDHQWNRKHIFVKTLTLISKLFPFETKQTPKKMTVIFPLSQRETLVWKPILAKTTCWMRREGDHSRDTRVTFLLKAEKWGILFNRSGVVSPLLSSMGVTLQMPRKDRWGTCSSTCLDFYHPKGHFGEMGEVILGLKFTLRYKWLINSFLRVVLARG